METSLKTGFAQVFSCCPKNLSCPNFGGAAAPLAPPARTPMQLSRGLEQARRGKAEIMSSFSIRLGRKQKHEFFKCISNSHISISFLFIWN